MQSGRVKRREFMMLLGGAATAWPIAVRAQPLLPVIGFLSSGSLGAYAALMESFRQGLKGTGNVEGRKSCTLRNLHFTTCQLRHSVCRSQARVA
jgi:hypothetical protein